MHVDFENNCLFPVIVKQQWLGNYFLIFIYSILLFCDKKMKQICKEVYENYPAYDLTERKDFIKTTVKELIS